MQLPELLECLPWNRTTSSGPRRGSIGLLRPPLQASSPPPLDPLRPPCREPRCNCHRDRRPDRSRDPGNGSMRFCLAAGRACMPPPRKPSQGAAQHQRSLER
eukprot:TRINITY_DN251_c0_g1_i2.p2 TRINITY_DN251_c0_g1~~TRINITY_DN251_c0_g1_i2.p2  ORF type:complete len:102 (+),score=3.53 TRINITY_DN251_c0_g1_i2:557-862(+)